MVRVCVQIALAGQAQGSDGAGSASQLGAVDSALNVGVNASGSTTTTDREGRESGSEGSLNVGLSGALSGLLGAGASGSDSAGNAGLLGGLTSALNLGVNASGSTERP